MEMMAKPDPRQAEILPVVRYSASRKAARAPDYWDHATLLELAVLARDEDDAEEKLGEALALGACLMGARDDGAQSRLIREMREGRGEDTAWIKRIEDTLNARAKSFEPPKAAG